jgi:hypothetical protein
MLRVEKPLKAKRTQTCTGLGSGPAEGRHPVTAKREEE